MHMKKKKSDCYNNLSVQTSYVNKHALEDSAPHNNSVAMQDLTAR